MELRLLEYFIVLSEELHYTKAAEKLGISQPTLSQQIRLLEKRIDAKLFYQKGKKIYLSDSGKVLLYRAKRIFYELQQAESEIQEIHDVKRGKITIGCSGNHLLHNAILSFHEQFPDIELSIIDTTTEETVDNILHGSFDIGVVFLPVHDGRMHCIPLFTSELFLVCSKEHPLSQEAETSLARIEKEKVFLLQKHYALRQNVDAYCQQKGLTIHPLVELSDTFSLLEMVVNNNGVTILPKSYVEKMNDRRVQLVRLNDPLPKKEVGVIFQKNTFTPAASKAFIDHLLATYKVKAAY
ncbi:transcriptional regulator, LysR family [Alteribacillus persepolensis]|uniref:Transcriptional regulator, LysR family n=1 Tax=Alteribacillus persepolensis TaxID=568899 RepID=A0A1G8A5I1_9BACI|nr:LysR family transcriptional regulator [Alteribacillus persepolensis]SDH16214.1 transcriptional regulator, LysR family [Alteribacillus persepolensis]